MRLASFRVSVRVCVFWLASFFPSFPCPAACLLARSWFHEGEQVENNSREEKGPRQCIPPPPARQRCAPRSGVASRHHHPGCGLVLYLLDVVSTLAMGLVHEEWRKQHLTGHWPRHCWSRGRGPGGRRGHRTCSHTWNRDLPLRRMIDPSRAR